MRLEIASNKAIRYACMNFHYAKAVPVNPLGFSVFENGQWCGVITYSLGATINIAKEFGLNNGQVIELTRMALNGKQSSTSKVLALSLKLVKKKLPLCSLIVSYADCDQDHTGVIYQATNWFYLGKRNEGARQGFYINGKVWHNKSVHSAGCRQTINDVRQRLDKNAYEVYTKGKLKYIYPINKKLIPMCKSMAKPYPKNAAVAHKGERQDTNQEGAFDSTSPLNLTEEKQ